MSQGTWLAAAATGVALAATVAWCGVEPEPPQRVLANALCAAVPVDQIGPLLATDPAAVVTAPYPEVPWHQTVTCNLTDGEGEHRGFVSVANTGTGGLPVTDLLPIYQNLVADSSSEDRARRDVVEPLTVQGRDAYFVVFDHSGSGDRNRSLTIQVTEDATLEILLSMSDEQRGIYTDPTPLVQVAETLLTGLEG